MKRRWSWMVIAVIGIVGIGAALGIQQAPVTVKTHPLEPRHVEQTVVCNGVVEAGESDGVFLPFPGVFREVTVQPGQYVEQDTVVAVLDKEATRQMMGEDRAALLALAATEEQITAPTSGIAIAVKAKVGQVLETGTPCVTVAPRSALRVRITIREKELPKLKTGMAVTVTGDGFRKQRYGGILTEISYTAALAGTGASVEGVVTLDEGQADDSLRLGLTAKAEVVVKTVEEGLVVPYEAVKSDSDGRDYVYVLQDGRAVRKDLTVAAQLGEGLLLADTALQGQRVILQPDIISDEGVLITEGGV